MLLSCRLLHDLKVAAGSTNQCTELSIYKTKSDHPVLISRPLLSNVMCTHDLPFSIIDLLHPHHSLLSSSLKFPMLYIVAPSLFVFGLFFESLMTKALYLVGAAPVHDPNTLFQSGACHPRRVLHALTSHVVDHHFYWHSVALAVFNLVEEFASGLDTGCTTHASCSNPSLA